MSQTQRFFHCDVALLYREAGFGYEGTQCRISQILRLTGVGGKQGAALAVDDLLNKWHFLRDRCGHHTEARHHGIKGRNSSHHTEVGIKIWRQERNKNEITPKIHLWTEATLTE